MTVEDRLAYWQRRARDAEHRLEYETEHAERTTAWAHRAFDEQTRLADRLHKVMAVASKMGVDTDRLLAIVDGEA